MINKKIVLFFVSLLLVAFSLGCILPGFENNSSEIPNNVSNVSENTDSESVNVGSSESVLLPYPSLAELIKTSNIIAKVTVVDIQDTNYTVKINEILKTNPDIEIGEEITLIGGNKQILSIGDQQILIKSSTGGLHDVRLSQKGETYSNSFYQISLEDLKTFIQKPDDYYEKYTQAFNSYDIIVAKMLTDTDVNKIKRTQRNVLPYQPHKIEVIYSASGKITGNAEFEYRMWYFPEKILQEIDYNHYIFNDSWIKTSESYYLPSKWNPESSFLKKDNYYIIYVGTGFNEYGEMVLTSSNPECIEKYDSETQKELKEFIEEYREIYEDVKKYN